MFLVSVESVGRVRRDGAPAPPDRGPGSEGVAEDISRGSSPHRPRPGAAQGVLDGATQHQLQSGQVPKIQIHSVFAKDSSTLGDLWSRFHLLPASLRFLNTSSGVPDSASLANPSVAADQSSLRTRATAREEQGSDQILREPGIKVDRSIKLYGTSEASGSEPGELLTKEVSFRVTGMIVFPSWDPT